ncbi:MAG TPA: hypothetical protein VL242_44625 [Sorangium sp.]|nr:hypothetical protein [Sorangium sp.]
MTAKPIATQAIIARPSGEASHIAPRMSSIVRCLLVVSVRVRRKADLGLVLPEGITSAAACWLSIDSR